ncbi:MAG: hypothetical protein ACRDPD_08065 [Streptosporangiaceae bacterium]
MAISQLKTGSLAGLLRRGYVASQDPRAWKADGILGREGHRLHPKRRADRDARVGKSGVVWAVPDTGRPAPVHWRAATDRPVQVA